MRLKHHEQLIQKMVNKHAEENAVGRVDGAPTPVVTKLNERKEQEASGVPTVNRRRVSLASTSPQLNRARLGG